MSDTKVIWRTWHAWETEKIEEWLEQEESNGWHLVSVNWSIKRFEFQQSTPQKIAYALDFRTFIFQNTKREEYLRLLTDDHWQLVNAPNSWHLWRKPYTDIRPRLYSDKNSLVSRIHFIMLITAILLIPLCSVIVMDISDGSYKSTWPRLFFTMFLAYSFSKDFYTLYRLKKNKEALLSKQL